MSSGDRAGSDGFTLIEMLVVLLLISISVAIVYPSMFTMRDKYDDQLKAASDEQSKKKEAFTRFVTDGLPHKTYSTATVK